MKTFLQWAEENELALPGQDTQVTTDAEAAEEDTKDENRTRTGVTQNYPDAYVRSQYPHKWFNPTKATTDLDIEQQPSKSYKGPKVKPE